MTERPAKCPECESDNPKRHKTVSKANSFGGRIDMRCAHPWHSQPDASPTFTPPRYDAVAEEGFAKLDAMSRGDAPTPERIPCEAELEKARRQLIVLRAQVAGYQEQWDAMVERAEQAAPSPRLKQGNTHTVLLPMTQNEADRLYKWFENTLSAVDADSPFQFFLGKLMRRLNKNFQSAPVRKIPERLVEWERLAHTSGFPEEAQRLMDDMMSALLGLVDPPESDDEKLTYLADQIEAALVPNGTCWPGFGYASARSKVKTILRYELALARAGK